MNSYEIDQATAVLTLIVFLFGIMIGLVLSVSWASRLEDSRYSLSGPAPSALAEGVRVFQRCCTPRDRPSGNGRRPDQTRSRPAGRGPGGPAAGAPW